MTQDQLFNWYSRNIDIKNRVIYFGAWQPSEEMISEDKEWTVNDWSAQNLIKGLYVLDGIKKSNITIMWFSYGGDWDAGMAIYDFIKHIKSPVTMKCLGRVRSMGTVVLQACKKRLLYSNCLFLIHYGNVEGGDKEHSQNHIRSAKYEDKCNRTMEGIYLKRIKEKRPKYTKDKLKELMTYDKYMTPHEAVYLGLADRVI